MPYTVFRASELEWQPRGDDWNAGEDELVLFIYGAPPEQAGADFYPDVS